MKRHVWALVLAHGLWAPLPAQANELQPNPAKAGAAPPSFEQVKAGWKSSERRLLDRNGAVMHRLRVDERTRRLDWVRYEEFSAALTELVIASEDQRFHEHSGVDWVGALNAGLRNLRHGSAHGASTLTMQLSGLLEPTLARGAQGREWSQKIAQARYAQRLEKHWGKAQILEAYLNLAAFRGEWVGVDAASAGFFGKHPSGLNRWEAALMAVLLRAPNASAGVVAQRACRLLVLDNCVAYEGFVRLALARAADPAALASSVLHQQQGTPHLAPHVARQLLRARAATQDVCSTLDQRIQQAAVLSIERHLATLQNRQVNDAAVLVLDNPSGEVLAWVGGRAGSGSAHVDGVTALRQAGSTLKPFIYGQAMERRLLTAASWLDDSPLDIATATGVYRPRNHDGRFHGPVSLRLALGSSLNIPAVRTAQMLGPEQALAALHRAGFESLRQDADHYGHALALGAADVSLLELTQAYRSLANGGRLLGPIRLTQASAASAQPVRVFSRETSYLIADILADANARVASFGTDSVLSTRVWSAVKTGTSKDMRDNWCIGFTERYTVGVWVGNFDGEPMWNVSGVTGAAPIWSDMVSVLHRELPSRPPAVPMQLVARELPANSHSAARREWFLPGTELTQIIPAGALERTVAIQSPQPATRFALDPDIPLRNQKIVFVASGAGLSHAQWRLDNVPLGRGGRVSWFPLPGKHRLELWLDGERIDSRDFEVRGAQFRNPRRNNL